MAYLWNFAQRLLFGEIQAIDSPVDGLDISPSDASPLREQHRSSVSDIPLTIARPRPRRDSVASSIKPEEDPAVRCLKERRRFEKQKLATLRQELESLIEFYKTSKVHASRLEAILRNDPLDPKAAVDMAKESNHIFFRTILDEVEDFSGKVLAKIEDLSPERRLTMTPRRSSRIERMDPFQRAETAMELLEDLSRERHREALFALRTKLQEDIRKDSALEIAI